MTVEICYDVYNFLQVWKYQNTDLLSDSALEQFYARIQTPEGQKETDVLLMGSKGGSFR